MLKFLETTGKTIDDAIAAALSELKLDRDSVSVEVLEKPKAGFLGIGGVPARVRVSYEQADAAPEKGYAVSFLEGIVAMMNIPDAKVTSVEEPGSISLDVAGSDMGSLIGRRGETLDALQRVVATAVNRHREDTVRVTVDTEGYRVKREESLISLATKTAERAVKYRRNIALEPMNSYSRHVIHTALQDVEGVSTHSVGVEPNRRVVISVFGGVDERYPSESNRGVSGRGSAPSSGASRAPAPRRNYGGSARGEDNRQPYREQKRY